MAGQISGEVLERIKAVVGPKGWIADAADIAPYLEEQRGAFHGATPLVVRPATTAEVAAVVELCAASRTPIVPQGGNTGLCGGAVPHEHGGELLLSLSRLNDIRAIDSANNTITVEAGCVLADIQAAAAAANRLFPLSLAAEESCQIGGNLSTNAGGTSVLRYGSARALTLGLEVVLPDGRVWDGLRGLRKDNSGYDLKQVFIGAEGTLGLITAAVLELFPRPRSSVCALIAVRDVAAGVELLHIVRETSGDAVSAWELIPRIGLEFTLRHVSGITEPLERAYSWYVLAEWSWSRAEHELRDTVAETLGAAQESGLVLDAALAASEAQAQALWRIRETLPEAEKHEGSAIKHDISVPLSRVAEFVDQASAAVRREVADARIVAFGHLGDGNIHFNLQQPAGGDGESFLARRDVINRVIHDIAVSLGGSVSAEHGIGRLKREDMRRYKSEAELDLMRALKQALDPDGIMNPGKVI